MLANMPPNISSKKSFPFVNTLPYISNPIEEFADFKFVSCEREIYPKFRGDAAPADVKYFTDFIVNNKLKNIIDFGVGGGFELSGIIKSLEANNYKYENIEANEIDEEFLKQARNLFLSKKQNVSIHRANWLDLPQAWPPYSHSFDFGFLTGNSLTYIGGGTREYTKKAQQSIVSKFAQLIDHGGYLFIDTRNYDYIRSLMNLDKEKVFENFSFDYTVYYQGFQQQIFVFPAYISETVVVFHYYDIEEKKWSKLDLYPIYEDDMLDILSKDFVVEEVLYDFGRGTKQKSLFVQYLAKRI